jgi:hypothetical protein
VNPFPFSILFDDVLEYLEVLCFKTNAFHGLDVVAFYGWTYC